MTSPVANSTYIMVLFNIALMTQNESSSHMYRRGYALG
jgi:hypothetical protein